jgi:hypothetical protein
MQEFQAKMPVRAWQLLGREKPETAWQLGGATVLQSSCCAANGRNRDMLDESTTALRI